MTTRDGRRGRGRPPVDENDRSVSVHLRLPARTYEAAARQASQVRVSLPEYIRRRLDRQAAADQDPEDD